MLCRASLFQFEAAGFSVVGVDASLNGLLAGTQTKQKLNAKVDFVNADARHLPFKDHCFDGIYCFGLLHEFTSPDKDADIRQIIAETKRLMHNDGIFILTVAAGEPEAGLPQVQLFSQHMLEQAMTGWRVLDIKGFDDIGCTKRVDYHIWYGVFEK